MFRLALVAVLGFASVADAQTTPPPTPAPRPHHRHPSQGRFFFPRGFGQQFGAGFGYGAQQFYAPPVVVQQAPIYAPPIVQQQFAPQFAPQYAAPCGVQAGFAPSFAPQAGGCGVGFAPQFAPGYARGFAPGFSQGFSLRQRAVFPRVHGIRRAGALPFIARGILGGFFGF